MILYNVRNCALIMSSLGGVVKVDEPCTLLVPPIPGYCRMTFAADERSGIKRRSA